MRKRKKRPFWDAPGYLFVVFNLLFKDLDREHIKELRGGNIKGKAKTLKAK